MAVQTKDDKVKSTQSAMDATPSNYQSMSVRSNNGDKDDGQLS